MGVAMFIKSEWLLVVVLAILAGAITGSLLQLNRHLEQAGEKFRQRFTGTGENFVEGMITSFLLFCMGAMTILGAIEEGLGQGDRKSTRLNSSHVRISYAVFCLKKKNRE